MAENQLSFSITKRPLIGPFLSKNAFQAKWNFLLYFKILHQTGRKMSRRDKKTESCSDRVFVLVLPPNKASYNFQFYTMYGVEFLMLSHICAAMFCADEVRRLNYL